MTKTEESFSYIIKRMYEKYGTRMTVTVDNIAARHKDSESAINAALDVVKKSGYVYFRVQTPFTGSELAVLTPYSLSVGMHTAKEMYGDALHLDPMAVRYGTFGDSEARGIATVWATANIPFGSIPENKLLAYRFIGSGYVEAESVKRAVVLEHRAATLVAQMRAMHQRLYLQYGEPFIIVGTGNPGFTTSLQNCVVCSNSGSAHVYAYSAPDMLRLIINK